MTSNKVAQDSSVVGIEMTAPSPTSKQSGGDALLLEGDSKADVADAPAVAFTELFRFATTLDLVMTAIGVLAAGVVGYGQVYQMLVFGDVMEARPRTQSVNTQRRRWRAPSPPLTSGASGAAAATGQQDMNFLIEEID